MLADLNQVLAYGEEHNCAITGFNVFGYEDAYAVVKAAEKLEMPVVLMANKVAVAHMPVKILGSILKPEQMTRHKLSMRKKGFAVSLRPI